MKIPTFRVLVVVKIFLVSLSLPIGVAAGVERLPFHRGDVNDDGQISLVDALALFNALFFGQEESFDCLEAADFDNSGLVGIHDGIFVLSYLFLGGPEPAPPGPVGMPCGVDPDPEWSGRHLGCERYTSCDATP